MNFRTFQVMTERLKIKTVIIYIDIEYIQSLKHN